MNSYTILGILAIIYGIYTFYSRTTKPEKLIKLKAMKQLFGDKKGNIVHLIGYSFLPILLGIMMALKGLFGIMI